MGKINVLPSSVAELIAAGEVIDRPASIVKELVENSLDAQASRITVEIRGGGINYLRVTDNGAGISRQDLPLAFIRHATSKIASAADLDSIMTLGFRGEALPSIAAVSRVKVIARTASEEIGSVITSSAGELSEPSDTGCPVGTSFEVRDVFYNTPARMKFLKKDVTEGNAIAALIDRLVLANPAVAFQFIRDGKTVLQTPGDGNLLTPVRVVYGADAAAGMIPVSLAFEGVTVNGLISQPNFSRATRSLQSFFINSRFIRSKTCANALEEAYKNRLMIGRFPACVLNVAIDCSLVDVNVHPAKLEVRFSNERMVYNAVYSACVSALAQSDKRSVPTHQKQKLNLFSLSDFDYSDRQQKLNENSQVVAENLSVRPLGIKNAPIDAKPRGRELSLHDDTQKVFLPSDSAAALKAPAPFTEKAVTGVKSTVGFSKNALIDIEKTEQEETLPVRAPSFERTAVAVSEPEEVTQNEHNTVAEADGSFVGVQTEANDEIINAEKQEIEDRGIEISPYRVIGEIFDTYILIQQSENFIIIDKHAAHERYIYNKIKHIESSGERQLLISPQAIRLPREEYFALIENPEALSGIGISAEDFGDSTLMVREIPMLLDGVSLTEILQEVAKAVLSCKAKLSIEVLDSLLYSVSCRAAVMAGKKSTLPELNVLADMVLGEQQIRFCPHGRPVLKVISRKELEKMFGRLG